jgi:hypothetical protein
VTQRGVTSGGEASPESGDLSDSGERIEGSDLEVMIKRRQKNSLAGVAGGGGEGGMPGRTVTPRSSMPRGGMPGGEGGYGSAMQRGFPGRGMPGGEGGYAGGQGAGLEPTEIENLLFRFFDFTVEEGKRYRYRVQLVLETPNYQIRQQYLKDAKLAQEAYKITLPSEPSPVASVSTYNQLYVGKVKPADKPVDEPKVNLVEIQLDPELGTTAVYEMRPPKPGKKEEQKRPMQGVERGQLIDFTAKVSVVHPITRMVEEKTIDFHAGMVLLDIRGGEGFRETFGMPKDYKDRDTLPGEVLFMDANGWLSARTETNDELDYLAEAEWLEMLDAAKESNTTAPAGGAPDGLVPRRRGGEGG